MSLGIVLFANLLQKMKKQLYMNMVLTILTTQIIKTKIELQTE